MAAALGDARDEARDVERCVGLVEGAGAGATGAAGAAAVVAVQLPDARRRARSARLLVRPHRTSQRPPGAGPGPKKGVRRSSSCSRAGSWCAGKGAQSVGRHRALSRLRREAKKNIAFTRNESTRNESTR
eukprot:1254217-Rhodomonas_salina.1